MVGEGGIAAEAVAMQAVVRMRVTMNYVVDVTDISRSFRGMRQTSTGWRPHFCLSATRFFSGCGGRDGRGYNGVWYHDTNSTNVTPHDSKCQIAATTNTDIVEYNANSSVFALTNAS